MKRFLSLSLKLVLSLLLLIIVLLVTLPFLIDPNDYKDAISEQVKAQTGRTLHIPGEIKLSIFPWLGAKLGEVELENAPDFADKPFARMNGVDVRVQLLPLLDGDIKIGHLTLRGLTLNLQRDKNGRGNWEDLQPVSGTESRSTPSATTETPAKTAPSAPAPEQQAAENTEPSPAAALAALSIEGISIKDASLHWDDQQTQQHYQLEKLNLEIGRVSLSEAIPLELDFEFNSRKPQATVRIALKTQLQADLDKQRLNLSPFDARLDYKLAKSAEMAALNGEFTLSSQLLLDLKKQKYTLKQLSLQNNTRSTLLPGGRLEAQLESKKIRLDLDKQSLKTEFLALKAYGLNIESRLNVQQLLSKPRYLASVDIKEFNPRELLQKLEMQNLLPPTTDNKALTRARLGLRIIGGADDLLLKPMILQLDDSNLQGYVSVTGFTQPALRYKLALDQIDLDRYLPPATEKPTAAASGKIAGQQTPSPKSTPVATRSPAATSPTTAAADDIIKLPLALLRTLDINGQLSIKKLKLANLRLNTILLGARAKAGQIRLKPLSAKLYQGRYDGDIQLDVRRNVPRVRLNENLKTVAIGPLLKDLIGDDKVRGVANIHAKLSSDLGQGGLDIMAAKKSLNGELNFSVENGAVKGFNLAQYERELKAKLKKQPAPKNKSPLATDFSRLSGSAKIRNGLLDNRDLRAALPHARVSGQGRVDLVREQLDYRLDVKFTSTAEGQGGKSWEQMNKVALPIYIKGPFTQPEINVDYQSVLKQLAKRELKKQEQKLKQKLREEEQKLKQKANEKLQQEEEKIKQKAKDALKKLLNF